MLWKIPPKNAPTLRLDPPISQAPMIGKQFTLSLNITNSENVAKYQVTVQFDSTSLSYVGSNKRDDVSAEDAPILDVNSITLSGTITAESIDDVSTLAKLTFEVISPKTSTLTISDVYLTDNTGTTIRPWLADGEIIALPSSKEDVNADGVVNLQDLRQVASNFGEGWRNTADVNGDEIVNIVDLSLVSRAMRTQVPSE